MANEVRIRITGDIDRSTLSALDGIRAAMGGVGRSTDGTGDALRDLQRRFDELTRGAGEAGDEIRDVGDGLGDLDSGAREGEKSTGGLSSKLGGIKAAGAAAALAGIAAAALAMGKAFEMGMDRLDFRAKLSTQLGLTGAAAKEAGQIASEVYAGAFGESIDQVGEAVRKVYQDIGKGSKEWTKSTTQDVLNVATTFDQDLGGVTRAVGQMMRTGLAKDAKSALDVITVGFQQGVDKADDLLDTFNEYGTQFRKLGLDGQTAMGLLSQGLKAGARDADIVADALKEFSIRGVDGSKAVADGFKTLGLDAGKMTEQIAAGGPRATAALDLTLDRLRAIKDPAVQSATAVALFGTQAEDMGKALFALDPSTAVAGLGNVAGAAGRASDAMGDTPRSKIEAFKRSLSEWATNAAADALTKTWDAGEKLSGWIDKNIKSSPELQNAWNNVSDAARQLGDFINEKIRPAFKWFIDEAAPYLQMALDNARSAFDEVKNSGIPWVSLLKIMATWLAVVAGIIGAVVVGALLALSFQLKIAAKLVVPLYEAFKLAARIILDTLGNILHSAAVAFGWIPGIGPKLRAADAEFKKFANSVLASLNRIPSQKTVNVQALVNGRRQTIQQAVGSANARESRSAFGHGGIVGHAAEGGPRGGSVLVGEYGPELVDLAPGSTVHSNPDTTRMLSGGGGGQLTLQLEWVGGNAGDEFMAWLQRNIRIRGGVTAALGSA